MNSMDLVEQVAHVRNIETFGHVDGGYWELSKEIYEAKKPLRADGLLEFGPNAWNLHSLGARGHLLMIRFRELFESM